MNGKFYPKQYLHVRHSNQSLLPALPSFSRALKGNRSISCIFFIILSRKVRIILIIRLQPDNFQLRSNFCIFTLLRSTSIYRKKWKQSFKVWICDCLFGFQIILLCSIQNRYNMGGKERNALRAVLVLPCLYFSIQLSSKHL